MSDLRIQIESSEVRIHHNDEYVRNHSNSPVTSTEYLPLFPGLYYPKKLAFQSNYEHYDTVGVDYYSSESEVDDLLPAYECTLSKQGIVHIKHEVDATGVYCSDRRWNRVLLNVEGTRVKADYGPSSKRRSSLLASLGLDFSQSDSSKNTRNLPSYTQDIAFDGAILLPAEEYACYKPYTFRVLLASKKQFLIRSDSVRSAMDWVETLQSVINISSDLDWRQEPQFSLRKIIHEPYNYI